MKKFRVLATLETEVKSENEYDAKSIIFHGFDNIFGDCLNVELIDSEIVKIDFVEDCLEEEEEEY